jgi:formiminotetrahydrofolate cyclodeaminase
VTHHDVLEKILDTNDATVGGGSAAALSGAMAAGLIGMVALLSVGKDYGLPDEEYRDIERRCGALRQELLAGCMEDTVAYGRIVAAYKLPKGTDGEKQTRQAAIQAAGIKAATTPRDNAKGCGQVLALGKALLGKSNRNAFPDLSYGVSLARLGVEGCIANIEANLPLIKEESIKKDFQTEITTMKEKWS